MNGSMSPPGTLVLRRGLERLRASAMLKQSLLVFSAGMVLNLCGFIAHAVASRQLGVTVYGGLYALINAALIAAIPAAFVAPVVAQLAAEFRALHDDGHLRGLTDGVSAGFAKLGVVYVVLAVAGAVPFAHYLHVPVWSVPFVGLLAGIALFVSALRAVAQGTQDFIGYSVSNSIEGIAKVAGIGALIAVGLKLGGGMVGFLLGPLCALCYLGIRLKQRYANVAAARRALRLATHHERGRGGRGGDDLADADGIGRRRPGQALLRPARRRTVRRGLAGRKDAALSRRFRADGAVAAGGGPPRARRGNAAKFSSPAC